MFPLPPLPYGYDALQPAMSANTLRFHHDKHHATYVKTLNRLLEGADHAPESLEAVIKANAAGRNLEIFNNAAQAWNHAFFWEAMSTARLSPQGDLAAMIAEQFGGLVRLREAFVKTGSEHFGSGWVWLAAGEGGALTVIATHDAADTVSRGDVTPLLVCDLWEHAYYLDYQNDRRRFLETWFDTLANWRFAASQLSAARTGRGGWLYPAPERASHAA